MQTKQNFLTATILSMSLLTVMAAAAVAPALGIIRQHFSSAPDIVVQMVISLPALFIIATNLCFLPISRVFKTRTIALIGLILYIVAGCGCFLVDNIYLLLIMRALLGVSVGLIMPLSTGLLAYYFPPEQQAKLMGLSAAMNQMGGVIGTLLAGMLASIEWNYAFLIYGLAVVTLLMVVLWLPNDKLDSSTKRGKPFEPKQLLRYHPSVVGMFLLTVVFFIFPTNFAIITAEQFGWSTETITGVMVGLDVVAFFAGLVFGSLMKRFRCTMKYFPPIAIGIGFLMYAYANGMAMILIGSALIGLANGFGVPYFLTIASIKAGKNAATTVMPLLSAALYLGQFLSPFIIQPTAKWLFSGTTAAYKAGAVVAALYLIQVVLTRKWHSLPPESKEVAE